MSAARKGVKKSVSDFSDKNFRKNLQTMKSRPDIKPRAECGRTLEIPSADGERSDAEIPSNDIPPH